MAAARKADGEEVNDKSEIADVFAAFYEDLYASRGHSHKDTGEGSPPEEAEEEVDVVTSEEVTQQLTKMAKGKAADEAGVVVEMLQKGGEKLAGIMAEVFTAIFKGQMEPPEYWTSATMKVLYKDGDDKDPANYRPICLLPIVYKVFSKVLCNRMTKWLDAAQPVDQAGFRSGFSCEDHLFTVTQLAEKYREFRLPLWVGVVDFKKAFDCVEHSAIWRAVEEQKVLRAYIRTCQALYKDQTAKVVTDVGSRQFAIGRGTNKGIR